MDVVVGNAYLYVGPEYFNLKDPIGVTVYAVSPRTGRVLISYDDYEFAQWVEKDELRELPTMNSMVR